MFSHVDNLLHDINFCISTDLYFSIFMNVNYMTFAYYFEMNKMKLAGKTNPPLTLCPWKRLHLFIL